MEYKLRVVHRTYLAILLATSIFLTGCHQSTFSTDSESSSNSGEQISLSQPFTPDLARAVNIVNLRPEVVVGDQSITFTRTGENWQGSIQLPPGDYTLDIAWFESLNGTELQLASAQKSFVMNNENLSVSLEFNEYSLEFDNDNDGVLNIEERRLNSDPFDPTSPRTDGVNVEIPFIAPPEAPLIDGFFDTVWNNAKYVDIEGNPLAIDNLILGSDNTRSDGNTEFQWAAMHDTKNIYLMIFYENVDSSALFSDSEIFQDDDSLDIYIDGSNDSKNTNSNYDNVDDYILRIPLLKSGGGANQSGIEETRFESAAVSAPTLIDVQFFNCFCAAGRHIWEIQIPLEGTGIELEQAFGFELQISDDQDGGTRDAKWAWFEPSNNQIEDAEVSPSVFGTVILD